jgi:hypothetical protein
LEVEEEDACGAGLEVEVEVEEEDALLTGDLPGDLAPRLGGKTNFPCSL